MMIVPEFRPWLEGIAKRLAARGALVNLPPPRDPNETSGGQSASFEIPKRAELLVFVWNKGDAEAQIIRFDVPQKDAVAIEYRFCTSGLEPFESLEPWVDRFEVLLAGHAID